MADLTIHNLDDAMILQLKRRAWFQGLSLEESMRRTLTAIIEKDSNEWEDSAMSRPLYFSGDGEAAAWRIPLHS